MKAKLVEVAVEIQLQLTPDEVQMLRTMADLALTVPELPIGAREFAQAIVRSVHTSPKNWELGKEYTI